ncbi:MAG TPA: pyridoxamine 5'-phosphate oxidase family protein [Propionibacteriaceae bacterium]
MTSQEFDVTARTTPSRNRQRVSYEREAVYAVLDEANLCHVGFVVDARPVVLPQLYARVGDQLYLHASSGARAMLLAGREAADVCVTVTLVDGMVLARSAFHHSVNYRSVVVHGRATLVRDPDERLAVLTALVDAVVPGRSAYTRGPNKGELAATSVLRLPLEEASLKARTGPPNDDQEDLGLPYWAGVLPVTTLAGPPLAAPDLSPHAEVPEHVSSWRPRRTSD